MADGARALQFAHVLFSLELYLLSPYLRRYIRRANAIAHLLTTGVVVPSPRSLSCVQRACVQSVVLISISFQAMAIAAASLVAVLSQLMASVFCVSVVFVSFLCPLWLMGIQKRKQKINGPWDEAVPKWSTRLSDFQRTHSLRPSATRRIGATQSYNNGQKVKGE